MQQSAMNLSFNENNVYLLVMYHGKGRYGWN